MLSAKRLFAKQPARRRGAGKQALSNPVANGRDRQSGCASGRCADLVRGLVLQEVIVRKDDGKLIQGGRRT